MAVNTRYALVGTIPVKYSYFHSIPHWPESKMYGSAMAPHHQMMSGSIVECVSDVENVAIFLPQGGISSNPCQVLRHLLGSGKYHAIIFALSSIRIVGLCSMGYSFDGSSVVSEISSLILSMNLQVNCASTAVSKN